jgi:ubiquitin C-terminal hydrolase
MKLKPHIEINERLNILGNYMNLYDIIFHTGDSTKTGHYTSAVFVKGKWYMADDERIIGNKIIIGNKDLIIYIGRMTMLSVTLSVTKIQKHLLILLIHMIDLNSTLHQG